MDITYKTISPHDIEEAREIYYIFRDFSRGGAIRGQVINQVKGVYQSALLISPMPPEIRYSVVAYADDIPAGVIACGNPSKGIISNTTHVVSDKFRGLGIGRELEGRLASWLGYDVKVTSYAGSSASRFHIRAKNTVAGKFKLTRKGSLMLDVIHGSPIKTQKDEFLFRDCDPIFESAEVERFVNECIGNPDKKFDELRYEVGIIRKIGSF